jgi:predicted nucleic acid-binding protein
VYVVDASVWVSRLVLNDVHHEPSYSWLEGTVNRGELIVAPALLLAEVAGAISQRTGRPELAAQAVDLLEQLPNSRLVAIDPQLAHQAAHLAGEHRLRGSDAFYVALAQQLGFSLVTWDREQAERGSAATPVITPV